MRHHAHDTSVKDFWYTPGGGLDDGESHVDGTRREILEETSVDATIG